MLGWGLYLGIFGEVFIWIDVVYWVIVVLRFVYLGGVLFRVLYFKKEYRLNGYYRGGRFGC